MADENRTTLLMNQFTTITVEGGEEGTIVCSLRTSEIIAFERVGKAVVVVLRGWGQPWTFNLGSYGAAKSLFEQIDKSLNGMKSQEQTEDSLHAVIMWLEDIVHAPPEVWERVGKVHVIEAISRFKSLNRIQGSGDPQKP